MKKTFIIIAAAAIVALLATHVSAQDSANGLVSTEDSVSTQADVLAAKFIKQVNVISKVKIDTRVLEDSAFRSLTDFSRPIPQELRGRSNPFAPF